MRSGARVGGCRVARKLGYAFGATYAAYTGLQAASVGSRSGGGIVGVTKSSVEAV